MGTVELDDAVVRACATAASSWPSLTVSTAAFADHVRELARGDLAMLATLHVAELYLVFACGHADPAAQAVLDAEYWPALRPVLCRMRLDDAEVDEALQIMREELWMPRAGGPRRILGYAGRGSLRGWLRAIAARTGLRVRKAKPGAAVSFDDAMSEIPASDAELELLRRRYGDAFRGAFTTAIAGLRAADRLLLRQRYRHGLTVDELGEFYGVDASTASRRVTAARTRLAGDIRAAMERAIGISGDEVSSILRLIHSQLDVSLSGLSSSGS